MTKKEITEFAKHRGYVQGALNVMYSSSASIEFGDEFVTFLNGSLEMHRYDDISMNKLQTLLQHTGMRKRRRNKKAKRRSVVDLCNMIFLNEGLELIKDY